VSTRIELCGALTVEIDGRRVEEELPGRQGRLLFAYLALNRDRPVRRDELVDVVWDEHPPGSPDAGLAALLTRVRRALGPEAIEGRGGVRLVLPEVRLDVEEASAAAAEAESALGEGDARSAAEHARAALALFERELLAELSGRWVDERRAELEALRSDALETLARAALRLGPSELPAAERAARTLIQREPYRESGYAVLMEALAAHGNLAEALRVYDRLRVLLRDELGATPAPHITALNERLLTQSEPAAAPAQAPPAASGAAAAVPLPAVVERREERPFVGRARELALLRERWDATPAGEGAFVVLAGEPGVGKTRLAARLAAEAHAGGATVLHGRIDEETVVPYQPFVEALRHYAAHAGDPGAGIDVEALAPLVPELGGGERAPEPPAGERENRRYRLFEAVATLLGQAARTRPLLLVIEDLQWAGRPTLLLLRHVVRRLHGAPLMVLVTVRDAEAQPGGAPARLLADLSRELTVQRVALSGLDETETAALVGDPELARALQARTAGNPFFIEEMLRSLAESPEESPRVPEGVKDLVSRRLARLEPDTVETLTAAAVLGREFRLATLAAMVARPGEELLAALEEALHAGLVLEDAAHVDRFSFGHALVRETLYDVPAHSRRARLHLRAGHALEAAGAPPGELAHHFFAAREVGGAEPAVAHGAEAARQAVAAHAYEEAAWHLEQALDALALARPDDGLARAELLIALGDVRWEASEPGARAAFEEAAELARREHAPEALARAVLGAGGRFYMPTALDMPYVGRLEEALELLGDGDGPLRARLLARLAEHLGLADADDRPARLGAEAVAMARRGDDAGALAAALMGRHAALLRIDHVDERLVLIDEALAIAERLEARELVALALHWRIYDLVELGEVPEAGRCYERLQALAKELQQPLYSHAALAWRGVAAHLNGHFDECERIARESLRIAEAAGAPEARAFFLTQLFAVRREQGRLAELAEPLERLARADGPVGVSWRSTLPFILVESGEPKRAREAYDAVAADGFSGVPGSLFRLTGLVCLAEACAALDDADGAELLSAELEPYADRLVQTGFSGCWGSVRRFLGVLATTAGRAGDARAHFEAALERHRELEAPGLVARTQCDLGELLLGLGERERGLALLAEGGAAAAELGMAGLVARADVSGTRLGAL
jgi:DNA-binding SARP family transcriptional activator